MLKLKAAYFYFLAVKILLIRFVKKIYFSTDYYNNSLKTKLPEQLYFYPNSFLLSSFINQKIFTFKLSKIDINTFWDDFETQKEEENLNSFFWLNLINRKINGDNIQKIIPFAVLIGSISCFNQWRKKNYYIISKTSGVSLWAMLSPILISFFTVGIVSVLILNPFATLLNKKYDNLQTVFFNQKKLKTLSFDTKGFWIKQISKKSNLLINASRINEELNTLYDVNIFVYDQDQSFNKRITAKRAIFSEQKINLFEVMLTKNNSEQQKLKKTSILIKSDQNNLNVATVAPEKIFIFDFPRYLKQMELYGLNTSEHMLQFFKLICHPFLIISMILLSASLMLRSSERKIEVGIISLSLVIGFALYFIGDFIFALGSSEKLPPLLSGFGPTLIGLFAGCYLTCEIDEAKTIYKQKD